jgi:nitronate monooxygenase
MTSWKTTPLTDLLGIRLPIIQAPMASASTPKLAAAVTNAGGLGSLGCAMMNADEVREQCETMRATTNGAYNVNFFVHKEPILDAQAAEAMRAMLKPYYDELGAGEVPAAKVPHPAFDRPRLEVLLKEKPGVVSFHFGLPEKSMVAALKEKGILIIASATTVAEARALEKGGADAIVAQGFEAGGHRGTFAPPYEAGDVGTLALVPQVVDAVKVPVIAAGGIGDGRGIAAALMLGASGVQMGTAFLTCPESAAHPVWRRALTEASPDGTRLSHAFSGRPARGLENRYMRETAGKEALFPAFPIPNALTGPLRKASAAKNTGDFQSMWAGQAAGLAKTLPAKELVEALMRETEQALARVGR